jgi:hypothetical protein
MTEIAEKLAKTMAADFEYFKTWYDFNFNIEKYLAPSDLEKVFGRYRKDVLEILLASEHSKTTARKNLLKLFNLNDIVDYDIDSECVKLAIKKKETLVRSMVVAGALFYYRKITKVVTKKELEPLVNFIGRDVYTFIIKRGLVLWKMLPTLALEEEQPSFTEKIMAAGKQILCQALVGVPDEIKKRLELEFCERFDIPEKRDEDLNKKCFDLIIFSMDKINNN